MARRRWRADRSIESRVLGLLFVGGATAVLVSLVFPEARQVDQAPLACLGALGYPVGAGLLLWGRRLPGWSNPVLLAAGTALTGAGVYFAHGAAVGASAALFYVWVTMFAFHFFSWRAAMCQLLFVAVSYAIALGFVGGPGLAPQWVLTMFSAAMAGAVMTIVSRRLRQMAVTDQLTGLPNRQLLAPLLEVELARAARERSPLCLALIDLDSFKQVNDRFGHAAGDDALVKQVRAWRAQLRGADTMIRYGGDEFIVVMPGASPPAARTAVSRLLAAGVLAASAGIAQRQADDSPDALIRRADRALYEAKHSARRPRTPAPSDSPAPAMADPELVIDDY